MTVSRNHDSVGDQWRRYGTMATMGPARRSVLWTALGCLLVGVTAASCSGSSTGPSAGTLVPSSPGTITTRPAVESSSPLSLGPGASVRVIFDGSYALSVDVVGHIDAVSCGGVRGEWRGTATLEDRFIAEKTRPVMWTFDSRGKAEVQVGPFYYRLSSGEHSVLFLIDLSLVEDSGSTPAVIVDRVSAVQPGFGTDPEGAAPQPPVDVTLGPVPGC